MTDDPCTCMMYDGPELLRLWRRRASPILRRWLAHGHRLRQNHFATTVRLVLLIDRDHEDVRSIVNRPRSHHRTECPQSIRNLCTVAVDTVSRTVPLG